MQVRQFDHESLEVYGHLPASIYLLKVTWKP